MHHLALPQALRANSYNPAIVENYDYMCRLAGKPYDAFEAFRRMQEAEAVAETEKLSNMLTMISKRKGAVKFQAAWRGWRMRELIKVLNFYIEEEVRPSRHDHWLLP